MDKPKRDSFKRFINTNYTSNFYSAINRFPHQTKYWWKNGVKLINFDLLIVQKIQHAAYTVHNVLEMRAITVNQDTTSWPAMAYIWNLSASLCCALKFRNLCDLVHKNGFSVNGNHLNFVSVLRSIWKLSYWGSLLNANLCWIRITRDCYR